MPPLDEKNSEEQSHPTADNKPVCGGITKAERGVYPFKGKIQDVAIYNKALIMERIVSHTGAGLNLAE